MKTHTIYEVRSVIRQLTTEKTPSTHLTPASSLLLNTSEHRRILMPMHQGGKGEIWGVRAGLSGGCREKGESAREARTTLPDR